MPRNRKKTYADLQSEAARAKRDAERAKALKESEEKPQKADSSRAEARSD